MELIPTSAKRWASLTILVVTALSCHSDRSSSPTPSALIRDALHDNGNAFFVWLPPLLHQQAPAGQVFSGQVSPTVTITNLCTGERIRSFAGSEVLAQDGQYHVNWNTTDDNLDASCTYRLAVAAGSRELGVADVDVVDGGRDIRNANTGEHIPLLDGRTLPIKFFVGIGSQCQRSDSDCGEGVVQPGESATIVTQRGQAGVFIPAGAVDQPVMVIIESADARPCIPGLAEPVFSGSLGAIGNSCYDFHTDPPLPDVNPSGKFNHNVTVGICVDLANLDHVTQDLLQIFQLHVGATPAIFALNNVPAPFLSCDPAYLPSLGSRRSLLGDLAAKLGSLVLPKPLHASATGTTFDVGAGGSAEMFSRFTWALPSQLDLNFDQSPDLSAILPGSVINTLYSRLGITFSRRSTLLGLCPGSALFTNGQGLLGLGAAQNTISPCPLGIAPDFSENGLGPVKATFALPAAEACISARPTGYRGLFPPPGGVAFLEALDSGGNVLNRTESTSERVYQRLCVQATGIAAVRFAGKGSAFAMFDNLRWAR